MIVPPPKIVPPIFPNEISIGNSIHPPPGPGFGFVFDIVLAYVGRVLASDQAAVDESRRKRGRGR
jgi:hypothetical protein